MAQPSPEKKQKLSSTLNKTQLLLQDYTTVRQTVRDILALVQNYGPLTAGQIEYNLPKVPSTIWGIPDVLNILTSLEILGNTEQQLYTWNGGIPRADTVLPTDVMSKIVTAMQEAEASWKRSEVLKQAVLKKSNHKDVLQQLLNECPDLVNDPVYLAALKACNIDVRGKGKTDAKPAAAPSPRTAAPSPRSAAPSPRSSAPSPRVTAASSATKPVTTPTATAMPSSSTVLPSPVSQSAVKPSLTAQPAKPPP